MKSCSRHAFMHVQAGGNVVVTTATASGKSLCFNVPVLQVRADPAAMREALPSALVRSLESLMGHLIICFKLPRMSISLTEKPCDEHLE